MLVKSIKNHCKYCITRTRRFSNSRCKTDWEWYGADFRVTRWVRKKYSRRKGNNSTIIKITWLLCQWIGWYTDGLLLNCTYIIIGLCRIFIKNHCKYCIARMFYDFRIVVAKQTSEWHAGWEKKQIDREEFTVQYNHHNTVVVV